MHGHVQAPQSFDRATYDRAQVRVGRTHGGAQTRVGQNTPSEAISPDRDFPPGQGPSLWCMPKDRVRQEPLGSTRASVAAGATVEFLFQPCSPFKLHYLTIPESFALLFTVMGLRICREDLIEGEVPAENFSDQGGFMNNIVNGRFAYPSIPARLRVRNDSGAAAFFNATMFGGVQDC
jgi:hypothetical protein